MKRIVAILVILGTLTGCNAKNAQLQDILQLRKQFIESKECGFTTEITAQIGDDIYSFVMDCNTDSNEKLMFTVKSPDSIAGIYGELSDSGASFTYDDKVLGFPLLAEGRISPVSAPWIFLKTLRSGYLSGYQKNEEGFILSMDDAYEENPLHLEIQTDSQLIPSFAEIYWQQQRVITLTINNFST